MPPFKSIADHKALFFTDLKDNTNTSNLFRWDDKYYCLVVIDRLLIPHIKFYRDIFAQDEMTNAGKENNHLMCFESIHSGAIKKVIEF
jgi:hypothetical protein